MKEQIGRTKLTMRFSLTLLVNSPTFDGAPALSWDGTALYFSLASQGAATYPSASARSCLISGTQGLE